MELTPSAHTDTFTRDHLPPAEQWPRLLPLPPAIPPVSPPESAPGSPATGTASGAAADRLNCAVELLDRTVERFGPDRPAFRTTAPGDIWSYGELRDRVDRIAHVLTTDLGVVPGNRVLLRGPTTPWLAACWLAVLKAGAVAVTVLAQHRAGELAVMCEIARVGHALCDARSVDELVAARVPGLRITTYGDDAAPDDLLRLMGPEPGRYEAVATAADDVALIAFTSGTTGRPKGCMHFHRDVLAVADTFARHVLRTGPGDLFAGSSPLGFTFGLGGLVIFPLRAGACALLLEQAGPRQLLAAVQEHRVSVLFTAPTAYRLMLDELAARPSDLSSLRRCVSAGENLPAATWRAWRERTGLRIINGIGATELLHIFISAAGDAIRPGTTGVPVPGWQARVVDAAGAPVPDGEPGLLAVRGPVGCRYLADPRQREYVRDGWNLTGDTYVREPDGYFRFVARADDMIISAGYNVPGPQVEEALLAHPDVVEAAVVGRPDEVRGRIVAAYVVLRGGVEPGEETAAALREFVRSRLVPYKCPRSIVFLDALPRTPTGKLQRFRLREAEPEQGGGTP
ncbi:AMP-binding protein [Streptomyces sp. NPDC091212]|uniref:AMP-binding protein n=1 Tax=Streptomyces sp. NPDC091212 TaxID=3155191 RepID=UPI003432A838